MQERDIMKKIITSALLLTTINDLISGTSMDIMAPIFNSLLPGDIRTPTKILNTKIYLTRYCVRLINFIIAILIVTYINKINVF